MSTCTVRIFFTASSEPAYQNMDVQSWKAKSIDRGRERDRLVVVSHFVALSGRTEDNKAR
jgi:hypothetical protein